MLHQPIISREAQATLSLLYAMANSGKYPWPISSQQIQGYLNTASTQRNTRNNSWDKLRVKYRKRYLRWHRRARQRSLILFLITLGSVSIRRPEKLVYHHFGGFCLPDEHDQRMRDFLEKVVGPKPAFQIPIDGIEGIWEGIAQVHNQGALRMEKLAERGFLLHPLPPLVDLLEMTFLREITG